MRQRLALTHPTFYFGLLVMLGTGILSATIRPAGGLALLIALLSGAFIALGARLWHRRLRRSIRREDPFLHRDGYPHDLLGDPRLISPRRQST